MIHRFVSKATKEKERKAKVELIEEFQHHKTIIKYPAPDPRDRVDDEYTEDDNKSE